jgi:polygalacturonase
MQASGIAVPAWPFASTPFAVATFPGRQFDVTGLGASARDNSQALGRAIAACHEAGGGKVCVPAGTWPVGSIHLLSGVNLYLEKGAVLRFSSEPADYLPVVFTRWEGVECYNYSPLIYASDCENVAVSGEGLLDGQGRAWWHWKKLQGAAAQTLYDAQFAGVPVEKRVYGRPEAALRPQFVQFVRCRQVLIEGITLIDGPMWTLHPVYCRDVLVRGVTVHSEGPNTDGLNPDSCCNVLIEDCSFATGDDCIAINAGMNEDGWRVGRPCENVVIRRCTMSEGHGAVAIGSGMSGGVRNVRVADCRFSGGDQGIRLKSMRGRGGFVENVLFENIHMSGLRQEAIVLNMFYGSSTAPSRSHAAPVFRDIHVRDVVCQGAGAAVSIRGLPEQPIERVVLESLRLEASAGIHCQDAQDLTLRDVTARIQQEPLFACSSVQGLNVVDMNLRRSDS